MTAQVQTGVADGEPIVVAAGALLSEEMVTIRLTRDYQITEIRPRNLPIIVEETPNV
jgi:hypothetical protein